MVSDRLPEPIETGGEKRMKSNRKTLSSKWLKTRIAEKSASLRPHVPETKRWGRSSFEGMLRRHGLVYVKPANGSCGVGVMRAELRRRTGAVDVQSGTTRVRLASPREAYGWIERRKPAKPYLVQQGIRVLRKEGRPIDFRVVIQRNGAREWEVSGMLARVASPGKAVTNGSQGGSIYSADDVLAEQAGKSEAARIAAGFERLARETARQFALSYPRMNELGLDIAVDKRLRSWILEVNTKPDPRPFALLDDPSMLQKILELAKGYGRIFDMTVRKAKKGR